LPMPKPYRDRVRIGDLRRLGRIDERDERIANCIGGRLCSVGKVGRARSRRVGRVIRQRPRAGKVYRRGYQVVLVVGRR
jgi:hypothetical protein